MLQIILMYGFNMNFIKYGLCITYYNYYYANVNVYIVLQTLNRVTRISITAQLLYYYNEYVVSSSLWEGPAVKSVRINRLIKYYGLCTCLDMVCILVMFFFYFMAIGVYIYFFSKGNSIQLIRKSFYEIHFE